jgi:hypothetical protein
MGFPSLVPVDLLENRLSPDNACAIATPMIEPM